MHKRRAANAAAAGMDWSVTPKKKQRKRESAHTECLTLSATEVHCEVQKHSDKEGEENEGSDKRFSVGNSLDPRVQCAEELAPSLFSSEEPPCSGAIYVLSESFREDYCMESYSYSVLQSSSVRLLVDYNPSAMLTTDFAPQLHSRSHYALILMLNEFGAAGLNTSDAEGRSPFISTHSKNHAPAFRAFWGSQVPNGDLFVELRYKCMLPRSLTDAAEKWLVCVRVHFNALTSG